MKYKNLFIFVIIGLIVSAFLGGFFDMVTVLGKRIPQDNLVKDYGIATVWAAALTVFLIFLPLKNKERPAVLWIWFVKCIVSLGVMLFYEHRYGLDAYAYYNQSLQDTAPLYIPYISDGTRFMAWFSWQLMHLLPLGGSYHALKIIYSFLGLLGVITFYKSWIRYFGTENIRWLYFIGFFPTILFWSSILGKDPIVFFAIGLYSYGTVSLLKTGKLSNITYIFLGVALASLIRFWLSFILVAPIGLVFVFRPRTGVIKKALILGVYVFGISYSSQTFLQRFQIETSEELLDTSNSISKSWSIGGSGQEVPEFKSFRDIIMFSPKGIFTALFRPLPGEVRNVFGLVSGLENLLFLGFLIVSIINRRRRIRRGPIFTWAVSLVIIWASIYGMVSYQNLGSAVRFKLQIIPILLLVTIALRWNWPEEDQQETNEKLAS